MNRVKFNRSVSRSFFEELEKLLEGFNKYDIHISYAVMPNDFIFLDSIEWEEIKQ